MIESRTALRQGTRALIALLLSLVAAPGVAWAAEPNEFAQALERGPAYAALAAFGSGLLVALTPCVYPMIAITVGVFGARKTKSRTEGALLSAVFVAGIVIMFVPLGVIAGLTGGLFGSVLSNPWVLAGMGALFLAMALSMFGAFDLDLPSGLKNRLAAAGGTGYWGALVLGLICGPIAAPCTGPFLTGILAWIAQTQSAMWGAAAMAAFALGIGVPFFFVGAFAVQLPKSGAWMLHVKSLLGIILSVVALYFLAIAFPWLGHWARPGRTFLALMVGVVVVGLLLGAVHKSFQHPEWTTRLSKLVGVLMVTWGGFLFVESLLIPEGSLAWETPTEGASEHLASTAQAKARQEQRPLLIDFTAAWCVACKEISKITFADQRVRREAARFVALMVDATDDTDPAVETTLEAFNVQGLPAVILFDSSGKEVRRFTQFVDPDRFLEALERIN